MVFVYRFFQNGWYQAFFFLLIENTNSTLTPYPRPSRGAPPPPPPCPAHVGATQAGARTGAGVAAPLRGRAAMCAGAGARAPA
jgi:hypothetical protein